jgi:virulence-associated protein VagC
MKTAELIELQGMQAIKLPDEFRFVGSAVSIRKAGAAVILEPVSAESTLSGGWPPGFFEEINISDPAFARPEQGETPPAPPSAAN